MSWIAVIIKVLPLILTILSALFGQDAVSSAWTLSQTVGAAEPGQWASTFGVNAGGTLFAGFGAWMASRANAKNANRLIALNARVVELVSADAKARELFAAAFGRDPKTIDRLL